jgi:hypothetical protein
MFGVMMVLSILFWIALAGGGFYLALRFVRAFELRGADRQELQELREQLVRLEEAMDAVTHDVESLGEEQRFTLKLLSERTGTPLPPHTPVEPGRDWRTAALVDDQPGGTARLPAGDPDANLRIGRRAKLVPHW